MYRANPDVNVELRERLPKACQQHVSGATRTETSPNPGLSSCSQASQHFQELPVSPPRSPVSHRRCVSPASPPSHRSSASPLSSRFLRGTGEMEVDLPSVWPESCRSSPDEGAASRGPGSPAQGTHPITAGNSPASARHQSSDRDKNICFLLKELDSLRELNNKLQEQLVEKEMELQRREADQELTEQQRDAQYWERPTLLLEEVLATQRDRDQALMARLLLANEERDAALARVRSLQQAAEMESLSLQDTDMDVNELLQSICEAESVQDIHQFGSTLLQHVQLTRQQQREITAQEMKVVMDERDQAFLRCRKLEEDLLRQKEQCVSQEELLKAQRERDVAIEERRRLEAEIQALRAGHRLERLVEVLRKKVGAGSFRAVM
ncbi:mirror-image polydactyly gene 1 protein isoform 2-T3 [Menidia menidia]